ncbi:MAG: lipid A 3-O-deacylase [Verrucomicrobiales bacterium]|jgi:lipid A 3-O-deacylase
MNCRLTSLCLLVVCVLSLPATGEDSPLALQPGYNEGYLTLYFDNDLFGGTDEDYTNGVRLSWISEAKPLDQLGGFYQLLDGFSDVTRIRGKSSPWVYNTGVSLTQLMFTPTSTQTALLVEDERPYAGWTGLGFSLHAKNEDEMHQLEVSVGIVGPNSLAENSQDFIHSVRDIEKSQGWDNQLEDEFTFNLHYRRTKRMFEYSLWNDRFEFESMYRWGADLGNAWINGQAGLWTRFGFNLPNDFSDPKLSPTAYTNQLFTEQWERINPWSLVFTFAAEGRAVARDIFLDGNTFEDSYSVDNKHFVADLTGAVGLRYKALNLTYAHTYRTREYDEQDEGQFFGSLSLGLALTF